MGTILTVICAIGGACVFIGGTYLIIKKFKKKKIIKKVMKETKIIKMGKKMKK